MISDAAQESKLSALPDGWRWVKLGEVCEVQLGKMLSPKSKTGSNPLPYLRNANVQWNRFDLSSVLKMDFSEGERRKFELKPGDLLVCEGGEPGRAAVWDGEIAQCYYQKALHRLRPISSAIDPHFVLYRLWLGAMAGEFMDSHAQTTIAHLPAVRLLQLPMQIPPLLEQKRIAAILREQMTAVERARAAAEAQLEAAAALPAAYLRDAFQGITPLSVGRDEAPAPHGWRWSQLTRLARLESGHTPSRYHPEWWGGDIPWIALPDIRALDGRTASTTSEFTNEHGIANSAARILPAGTVVLSRTASVGYVTVMGRPMATSQDFVNWVCGPELDSYFLSYLLQASRKFIRSLSSGAIHQTVYFPTVKAFRVCFPSLKEQKQIAARLGEEMSKVERASQSLTAQLEAIERLPAALLRRAFNGEL